VGQEAEERSPLDDVASLFRQIKDPSSKLMSGEYTRGSISLEILSAYNDLDKGLGGGAGSPPPEGAGGAGSGSRGGGDADKVCFCHGL
jgi:hypothetical protein